MEINKIYSSVDKKHQITISIIDDIAWFNIEQLEYEFFKTFLLLIKDTIEMMSKKGVKHIKQYIANDDILLFKYSTVNEYDENTYVVNTDIVNFMPEIINVFGLKLL